MVPNPDKGEHSGATTGTLGEQLATALLAVSPHVLVGVRQTIWVDARGLAAEEVGRSVLAIAGEHGVGEARVGIARAPIVAELAATVPRAGAQATSLVIVQPGTERGFLAPYLIAQLADVAPTPPSPALLAALADVGIERCADLAALTLEDTEVRFAAEGVVFWRLARAEDRRPVFTSGPRAPAMASLAWEEYALRDTERLAFVINRLAGTVCAELQGWGEGARAMTLTLTLVRGGTIEREVRSNRGTASRATWVRLLRAELERLRLPDAVTGLALRVEAAGETEAPQGDLFDRGLQTAHAVEDALTRLLDDRQATVVGLATTAHPRPERRARWRVRELGDLLHEPGAARDAGGRAPAMPPALSLQLLPRPRRIAVHEEARRGHRVPARYREQGANGAGRGRASRPGEIAVLTAAGPDRISGGAEAGEPYERDYFHCLTDAGLLVLLYRDLLAGGWYLHGWWD